MNKHVKNYEIWVNNFCHALKERGVSFDPRFELEDQTVVLKHSKFKDLKTTIENVLDGFEVKHRYVSLDGADTWVFSQDNVWHIVSYPTKMYIQWENIVYP